MEFFLYQLFAHLTADFILQNDIQCEEKREKRYCSRFQYIHCAIVFFLSWIVSFDYGFWKYSLFICLSHLIIDVYKSFRDNDIRSFVIDQVLHILILVVVAIAWCTNNVFHPLIESNTIVWALAILVCSKPANILIKLILQRCSVNFPKEKDAFRAGALIGMIERWLIILFVFKEQYEAIGLLIAAKSIIRFSDKETDKTEYVLAGTLLSILIGVISGVFIRYYP